MKIRGDIIRTYQSIHTWTGIVTGLILFIAFYAGSLTMFKPAIEKWATPSQQKLQQVSPEKMDSLINQAISNFEKPKQGFIVDFESDSSPLKWYNKGGGRGFRLDDELVHASLNHNDEIISYKAPKNELGNLIDQLHRTAGIIGEVGHEDLGVLILGLAAGLYFIAIISGVIFLLPTLVKSIFALRTNKSSSRFWLDSHNLVGVISLPFHIIIAWTAVVFAFHDPFYGGLSAVYGEKELFEPRARSTIVYDLKTLPKIQNYLDEIEVLAPDHQIKTLVFSNLSKANPSLAIEVQSETKMMRGGYSDYIYMNPYTMEVSYTSVFNDDSNTYGPIVSSFFALHFGNYAGDTGRWVYFFLGLLGAFLFYSGNLLWLEKRRLKTPEQTRSSKIMAALTVGVCFGSILGVTTSMLANKWIYLFSQQTNSYYLICYYSIFFSAISYALIRGAAKAAIHIQLLLAIACLAIPLTTLLAQLIPSIGIAQMFEPSYLIDLIAFTFSLVFFFSANKTKKRALHGDKNSVWSLNDRSFKVELTVETAKN